MEADAADGAEPGIVSFNPLIAARAVEDDIDLEVIAGYNGVADVVDAEAGVGIALLDFQDTFDGVEGGGDGAVDDINPELLEESQVFVGGFGGGLGAEFDAGGLRADGGRSTAGDGEESGAEGSGQDGFDEVSASHCVSLP